MTCQLAAPESSFRRSPAGCTWIDEVSRMYWIFGVKFINLGESCTMGGDPAMNIIARVPVHNVPEKGASPSIPSRLFAMYHARVD